jgi:hypothetical protein
MKIVNCDQGSPEWFNARLGIPTASQFDRILTPKTRKPSGAQARYMAELLAEWLLGSPSESWSNAVVERGTELEEEAARWYAFDRGVDVEKVGFVTTDYGRVGGSPDRLVGSDGILEIKNPLAVQHVLYLLSEVPEHTGQVQGYLWLTGRKWCDMLSYHPTLPPVVHRIKPDPDYFAALEAELLPFLDKLDAEKERFAEYRQLSVFEMGAV